MEHFALIVPKFITPFYEVVIRYEVVMQEDFFTRLEFDTIEDALEAIEVWSDFIEGKV
jgi:hypothetical protein